MMVLRVSWFVLRTTLPTRIWGSSTIFVVQSQGEGYAYLFSVHKWRAVSPAVVLYTCWSTSAYRQGEVCIVGLRCAYSMPSWNKPPTVFIAYYSSCIDVRILFRMTWTILSGAWYLSVQRHIAPRPCSSSLSKRNRATFSRLLWTWTRRLWGSWKSSTSIPFPFLPACACWKLDFSSWPPSLATSKFSWWVQFINCKMMYFVIRVSPEITHWL